MAWHRGPGFPGDCFEQKQSGSDAIVTPANIIVTFLPTLQQVGFPGKQSLKWNLACRVFTEMCPGSNTCGRDGGKWNLFGTGRSQGMADYSHTESSGARLHSVLSHIQLFATVWTVA